MMEQKLLNFCCECENLICYGAGDYANKITAFLEYNNIKVDVFCVSNYKTNMKKTFLEKPLMSMEMILEKYKNIRIIVAMDEKNHQEIENVLKKYNIESEKIFFIKKSFIDYIISKHSSLSKKIFINLILYNFSDKDKKQDIDSFKEKAEFLINNFKNIEIRYLSGSIGGIVSELIYYKDNIIDRDKFILLYLNNIEKVFEKKFYEPNEFIIEKFIGRNFEALNLKNITFWKYFLNHYRERITGDCQDFLLKTIVPKQIKCIQQKKIGELNKKYISFTNKELDRGKKYIKKYIKNSNYICIFSRDDAYYKEIFKVNDRLIDLLDVYRNSNIRCFDKTVNYFYKKEIYSVRMGKKSYIKYNTRGCVDYVNSNRNDFMDVYLNATCKFFIGDSSGAASIIGLFSKPTVVINFPFIYLNGNVPVPLRKERDLMILQKYWHKRDKRYLTIRDMIKFEKEAYKRKNKYTKLLNTFFDYYKNEIVPVKNTEQEILDVSIEMEKRIDGTMKYSESDLELKKRYWKIVESDNFSEMQWYFNADIGIDFLRNNQWLLE